MLKISLAKAGREIRFQGQADMAGRNADLVQVENDPERTCDLIVKYAFGRRFVLAEVGIIATRP